MIQRIQTIFLLLATITLACMLIFPLASFIDKDGTLSSLFFNKLIKNNSKDFEQLTILPTLVLFSLLASLIPVFLFRKRDRQMTWCILLIIVNLLLLMVFLIDYFLNKRNLVAVHAPITLTALCPIFAIILDYLAYKAIKKDDDLVRSLDRLR